MGNFRLVPYESKYAEEVKACALKAWKFTYQNIFSEPEIENYVNRFYSEENNLLAEELISKKLVQYTIALDEAGSLVGFQTSSINMLRAELMRIYIFPDKVGMGLGSALLRESENFFRSNGFKSYQVKVHKYNTLAQKFYERKGFIFLAEDDHDHLVLTKELR